MIDSLKFVSHIDIAVLYFLHMQYKFSPDSSAAHLSQTKVSKK